MATGETKEAHVHKECRWNQQLWGDDLLPGRPLAEDRWEEYKTALLHTQPRKKGQYHPRISLAYLDQSQNKLDYWRGLPGWNPHPSAWQPTNHRTEIPLALSRGHEMQWNQICSSDLCPTKKKSQTKEGTWRRSPSHMEAYPVYHPCSSSGEGGTEASPAYAKYAKVFDEPGEGELPPQWPFYHAIDLKDLFIPNVAKTYPMNPEEMKACKEFLDENLKAGKIQKSQFPQASPFFFVQRRMEAFGLARTTGISMSIQSKMPFCFPSSPP